MTTAFSPRLFLQMMLGLGCFFLFAAPACAGGGTDAPSMSLQANFLFEMVADRARLIQVSLVAVAFGIAILWWRR